MERVRQIKIFTGEDANLMSAVRLVMLELKRTDLNRHEMQYVEEVHETLVQQCIDKGFVHELCDIRDQIETEAKLTKLRQAYRDGEVAL